MANLNDLKFAVECAGNHFNKELYETIAAFDVKAAADAYAAQCKLAHPSLTYRVVKI